MLKIYNTLTKQKEEFNKQPGDKVRMFVCGPTVYDYPHIGHARTYVIFDVIAKYLRYKGIELNYLQNITDIDDKIIARAKERGIEPKELADKFEKLYYEDMKAIGIDSVSQYACATEHIPEIVDQVKRLIDKGHVYKIDPSTSLGASGGFYFDLSTFPDYGKLSGRTAAQAEDSVSRIDESVSKRNKGDFVLWKLSGKDEPGWDTELGYGRPGWHIEDTAISEKYLGQQYEIHGGAQDLMFPHHESEIAQQESASGKKPFVQYWLHSGLLTVDGKKMSKSLGNFVTIQDVLKMISSNKHQVLRMMFLTSHYRSSVDYDRIKLGQAAAGVKNLIELITHLNLIKEKNIFGIENIELSNKIENYFDGIKKALDDDFNTVEAIGLFSGLSSEAYQVINNKSLDRKSYELIMDVINFLDKILGIIPDVSLSEEIKLKVMEMDKARESGDFKRSDEIRLYLKESNVTIENLAHTGSTAIAGVKIIEDEKTR